MTLIAVATYGNRAEFLTDTASYTRSLEHIGRTTKHLTLNHLDAAVLTQGHSAFGDAAQGGALQASAQVLTYDELIEGAQDWLSDLWGRMADPSESHVIFVGWSNVESEFTTTLFASDVSFAPETITGLWTIPTRWTARPTQRELDRLQRDETAHGTKPEVVAGSLDLWSQKPRQAPPTNTQQWRDLGIQTREQRALSGQFGRVLVAGSLIHTRLRRGEVITKTIHEFNDAGEEFLQLVAFTQHPQGQVMPCWCGSGKRFIDCHLAPHVDNSCGCGSEKPFRDCCMVV